MSELPLWGDIRSTIPSECFLYRHQLTKPYPPGNHNGASSPFRFLYPVIYSRKLRRLIYENSYLHDAGYTIFQLPGSPWFHLTRDQWDLIYRQKYRDEGYRKVAWAHYTTLRRYGQGAWDKNRAIMERLYGDWTTYLTAKGATLPAPA